MKTLKSLENLILNKIPASYPFTHLALVGCKQRVKSIDPLLKTLEIKKTTLQTLIIPK